MHEGIDQSFPQRFFWIVRHIITIQSLNGRDGPVVEHDVLEGLAQLRKHRPGKFPPIEKHRICRVTEHRNLHRMGALIGSEEAQIGEELSLNIIDAQ